MKNDPFAEWIKGVRMKVEEYGHYCSACMEMWAPLVCKTSQTCNGRPVTCPRCGGLYVGLWEYLDEFNNWVKEAREEAGV